MTTMVVVWNRDKDEILMLNRQHDENWKGYTPPGGHVDFPESLAECAVREVREETGLRVWDLTFKGLTHFVNKKNRERFLVFNYLTDKYRGTPIRESPEGDPEWVSLSRIEDYDLAPGIGERLDLFFVDDVVEMHIVWDGNRDSREVRSYHV